MWHHQKHNAFILFLIGKHIIYNLSNPDNREKWQSKYVLPPMLLQTLPSLYFWQCDLWVFFNREKLSQIFDRFEAKVTQPDAKFRIRFRSFEKFPPICSTPIQRQPPDRSWKSSAFWKLSKEPSVRLSGKRLSQYNYLFWQQDKYILQFILVAFSGPLNRLSKKTLSTNCSLLLKKFFKTYKVLLTFLKIWIWEG